MPIPANPGFGSLKGTMMSESEGTDEFLSAAEEEESGGDNPVAHPGATSPLEDRLERTHLPPREDECSEGALGDTQNLASSEPVTDATEGGAVGVAGDGVNGAGVEGERVSGLDNRYVSEDAVVKGEEVEMTEQQIKELKEQAGKLKTEGNDSFKSGDYPRAVELYSEALELYPPGASCQHETAVCFANRAACHAKMEEHEHVIEDCSRALELEASYLKVWVRRAQAHEALEKYEEALEDYKKALELDPSQPNARQAMMYLPDKVKEQQEKLKAEMLGKLKELGNAVLKPFGLSTDNFQMQQDPNSGGYSVNFKR